MTYSTASLALALALLAPGCGGRQEPKTAAGPTCADAAATAGRLFDASAEGRRSPEQGTIIRQVFAERCPADAWSPAIVACFAAARSDADATTCTRKLSRAQVEAIGDALVQRLGEQMNRDDDARRP